MLWSGPQSPAQPSASAIAVRFAAHLAVTGAVPRAVYSAFCLSFEGVSAYPTPLELQTSVRCAYGLVRPVARDCSSHAVAPDRPALGPRRHPRSRSGGRTPARRLAILLARHAGPDPSDRRPCGEYRRGLRGPTVAPSLVSTSVASILATAPSATGLKPSWPTGAHPSAQGRRTCLTDLYGR